MSSATKQSVAGLRPMEQREALAKEMEEYIGTNWRISHHLNSDKDAQIMSTVPIFVWQRQGRNRAGLLILRADEPAVFWNTEQDQPYTIKLQVPATLTHKGPSILIVTLSKVEKLLTVEDIWVHEGNKLLKTKKYSERWPILEQVYSELNKQQMFLDVELRLIEPMSLDTFLKVCDERIEDGTVWEFQPDVPLRRRLVWMLPGRSGIRSEIPMMSRREEAFKTAARLGGGDDAIANEILTSMDLKRSKAQMPVHTGKTKPTTQPQPRIHAVKIDMQRCAKLVVDAKNKLPDTYFLEVDGGQRIGMICVPRLAQSQQLSKAFTTNKELFVDVIWNPTFKKYEVLKILPADTPLSPISMFYEHLAETT